MITPLGLHLTLSCLLSCLLLVGCYASKTRGTSDVLLWMYAVTQLVTAYLIKCG